MAGPFNGSLTEGSLGVIGGKNSGSIALGATMAGIIGGIAGAIGLVLAIDGIMNPPQQ